VGELVNPGWLAKRPLYGMCLWLQGQWSNMQLCLLLMISSLFWEFLSVHCRAG